MAPHGMLRRMDKPKSKGGRPTKYNPETTPVIVKGLARGGATDVEICAALEISKSTLQEWTGRYKELATAMKLGKKVADDRVVRSLYQRAVGFHYEAVKIFKPKGEDPTIVPYTEYVIPDTTACIFWLKNRDRANWRDKVDHDHAGAITVNANYGPPDDAVPAD